MGILISYIIADQCCTPKRSIKANIFFLMQIFAGLVNDLREYYTLIFFVDFDILKWYNYYRENL